LFWFLEKSIFLFYNKSRKTPNKNPPKEVDKNNLAVLAERNSNFFCRKSGFRFLAFASAEQLRRKSFWKRFSFQNRKNFLYFSDFVFARARFFSKRKRKFFGFGSPASFLKEPDAELLGFGGAEKRRRRN